MACARNQFAHYAIGGIGQHTLSNGLMILTREDHVLPVVSTMVWYKVGLRFEHPGILGISHFLEHMMFKGTDQYRKGEIDHITMQRGGSNNAFTSNDYTAYYFNFASDCWWPALEIEASRMRNNQFDPQEFELEKQVVIEELKMELDTPWGILRESVELNSFEQHPYRYPVVGLQEDLLKIGINEMRQYYEQFYAPNNATLVVVGDIDTGETLERVRKLFESLPTGDLCEIVTPAEKPRERQRRVSVIRPTHVPRMLVTFPAPSVRQREHYAMEILDRVFSDGKLSRLHRRLMERERVASLVGAEFEETFDPYLYFIRVELQEDADLTKTEQVLFEEIERLRQDLVSAPELARAKNQCITQFLEGFETTLGQAMQLGLLHTLDRVEYWHGYAEEILSVEAEEVRRVAERYWSPVRATVGTLVNGTSGQTSVRTSLSG